MRTIILSILFFCTSSFAQVFDFDRTPSPSACAGKRGYQYYLCEKDHAQQVSILAQVWAKDYESGDSAPFFCNNIVKAKQGDCLKELFDQVPPFAGIAQMKSRKDAALRILADEAKKKAMEERRLAKIAEANLAKEKAEAAKKENARLKDSCFEEINQQSFFVDSEYLGTISPWSAGGTPFTTIEVTFHFSLPKEKFTDCVKKVGRGKNAGRTIPKDWSGVMFQHHERVYVGNNNRDFIIIDQWGRKYEKKVSFVGEFAVNANTTPWQKKTFGQILNDVFEPDDRNSGSGIPMIKVK